MFPGCRPGSSFDTIESVSLAGTPNFTSTGTKSCAPAERHGVGNIRLFGSAARGEDTINSDVDLLVDVTGVTTSWFPGSLTAELEELLGKRVQVVIRRSLSPLIREAVFEGIHSPVKSQRAYLVHVLDRVHWQNQGRFRFRPRYRVWLAHFADAIIRNLQVLQNLQVLCESVRRINRHGKSLYSEIDWKAIAGMRNVLVHDYFDVDFESVWNVVTRDLVPLETVIRSRPGPFGSRPAEYERGRWASQPGVPGMRAGATIAPDLSLQFNPSGQGAQALVSRVRSWQG